MGTRLALNDVQDTSVLLGTIVDLEDGSTSVRLESERRLGQDWKVELEAQFFVAVDERNVLDAFRADDFVTVRLSRFF